MGGALVESIVPREIECEGKRRNEKKCMRLGARRNNCKVSALRAEKQNKCKERILGVLNVIVYVCVRMCKYYRGLTLKEFKGGGRFDEFVKSNYINLRNLGIRTVHIESLLSKLLYSTEVKAKCIY